MDKPTLIWDLDGTLLDSYGVIVPSLYQVYKEVGVELDQEEIFKESITFSVGYMIKRLEEETGISFEKLKHRYSEISGAKLKNIKLVPHALEVLDYCEQEGIHLFVITHRGVTTESVLINTGIITYFDEIITSMDGYPRKPDPSSALYLVDKYGLDKENTYYVGDRTLDVEFANNAGIKSILYLPDINPTIPTGKETYIVKSLLDIADIIH